MIEMMALTANVQALSAIIEWNSMEQKGNMNEKEDFKANRVNCDVSMCVRRQR